MEHRILVVEDNPVNQKVARRMLERMGYIVTVSGNGRQALERLAEEEFDLILMDCQMPEMDGYEATRAIRSFDSSRRYTPIIALTAEALKGDRERCLAAGMDDYLSKPLEQKDLRALIAMYLNLEVVSKSPSASNLPAISWSTLMDHAMGDETFAELLLGDLMELAPSHCKIMRNYESTGDMNGIARSAQTLKDAAASVGAERLRSICTALLVAALNGKNKSIGAHIDRITAELRRITAELINRRGLTESRRSS